MEAKEGLEDLGDDIALGSHRYYSKSWSPRSSISSRYQ